MRKIYICSTAKFPRGSASANYIQYLAKSLLHAGYNVTVVSYASNENKDYLSGEEHFVQEIRFLCIDTYKGKVAKRFKNILYKEKINKDDILITYSTNLSILNCLRKFAAHKKMVIGACVVEWFPYTEFKYGKLSVKYHQYQYVYRHIFQKLNFILPISHYIEEGLKKNGCSYSLCLPIMADAKECEKLKNKQEKEHEGYRFLVILNGKNKDALDLIFPAIQQLPKSILKKSEFYFKGFKTEQIKEKIGVEFFQTIKNQIYTYGWLNYNELINIYNNVDFLLLPRRTNQMTLANFPSKVPEVMGFGVVPIVSNVGDYTKEYLEDGVNAIFIKNCTVEGCKQAIITACTLSKNKYEIMSNNAILLVKNRFDYTTWSKQLKDFFDNLGGNYKE